MFQTNSNLFSIIVIIVFILIFLLPKFWKYFLNGLLLTAMGVSAILFSYHQSNLNLLSIPIIYYVVKVIIIIEGKNLLIEGIKEHKGVIKYFSIIGSLALIVMTTVPELYKLGAISFNLPNFPEVVIYYLYVVSGLLIILGAFSVMSQHKSDFKF